MLGMALLVAYIVWFDARFAGPQRWSIPSDPVPPLMGQRTLLVEAWMFAFLGVFHYVELRRTPPALF